MSGGQNKREMHKLSMKLNSAFDDSMYSECARQIKYMVDPIIEILNTSYDNSKNVGSNAEGTYFPDSDVDMLMIDKTVKVGYNPKEASTDSDKPYLCLTRGPLTPAGYTKLQIFLNGKSCENIENTILQNKFMHEIERYNLNTVFLTNRKRKESFDPLLHRVLVTDHGPAETVHMSNDETLDHVAAYESNIIPNDMNSWFERTRLKSWPSKTTCELFKSMGCCYVGIGHSKSPEQDLEWRISPTRQELYLMMNLNPTQFRCYVLLKMIKKLSNVEDCDDCISSYHCKTALFWKIENSENDFWQPHNLIECVWKCLEVLRVWVTRNKCSNYFIPKEDMFATKVMNEIKFEEMQTLITDISPIYNHFLLHIMKTCHIEMEAIIYSITQLKRCLSESLYGASSKKEYAFQQYIEILKAKPRKACIQEIQDLVSPHKIDIDILLEIFVEKLFCLKRKFHLKALLGSNTFTKKDITAYLNDPSNKSLIDHEYCLKLASIASTRGAYNTCNVLLQNLYGMTTFDIYCSCYFSFKSNKAQEKVRNTISENSRLTGQFLNQLPISDMLKRFSFCLQFRHSDIEAGIILPPLYFEAHKTVGIPSEMISIAMTNLKYERVNMIDLISIHPIVYMHLLQYKNSKMMNKKGDMCVALEKLEDINLISLQKGIYSHPDTTLNLLGHIYTTKGWYRLAVQCFRRSWQMEPHYNAVKWHVVYMLFCNLSIPEKKSGIQIEFSHVYKLNNGAK